MVGSVGRAVDAAAIEDLAELIYAAGWSDGLPVVPPARALVDRFVAASGRPAAELVLTVPPLGGRGTVEKIAANAVMAGCLPEHMPAVLAALEAMRDERFNLRGMQCSTHLSTPLLIFHGPIRRELGINCGPNVFGQGWRANATIGRAVKLALVNLGGAGRGGQGDLRPPWQVHLLHRRERRGEPLGAAARRARLRTGSERGDGLRRGGAA
jgi:hypothetical protein